MTRIAIYLTNTDRSAFAARHEDDAQKVIRRLRGVGAEYDFAVFDVTEGVFAEEPTGFDGVILTGSPAFVDEGHRWIPRLLEHVRQMAAAKTPLIGLCFGHQAIAAALGGRVERRAGWIFGAASFAVHAHRGWMRPPAETLRLYAANRAQVAALPPGFDLLGGSETCPIALTALGDHVFSTQFHPEMEAGFIAALLAEHAGALGPEVARAARDSLRRPAEGETFGRWMREFLEMPRR